MRIHLAGADKPRFIEPALLAGHRYLLTTYYKLKKEQPKVLAEMVNLFNTGSDLIIDSGLFTMMFGAEKDRSYDLPFMRDYATKYIADVKSYGIRNVTIVECDVHKILGMPAVHELRKQFADSGLDVIYVWHVEETIDGLLELATREKYIAISVPELRIFFKGKGVSYKAGVHDLLARIRAHCGAKLPRIHLLGNTVELTMRNHLAYSCDSTSWLAGVRYAQGSVYRNGTFRKVHLRSKAFEDAKQAVIHQHQNSLRPGLLTSMPASHDLFFNLVTLADSYHRYQLWLDSHYTWKGTENADPS